MFYSVFEDLKKKNWRLHTLRFMLDPICTIFIFGDWQLWIKTKTALVIRPFFLSSVFFGFLWPKLFFYENHKKFSQKVKKIVSKMIWTGMFESSWHIQESFQNCSKLLWNLRIPKVPQDKWEIWILMTIDVDDGLIHGERNHWIESYHNVWHVTCVTQHDGNMH